MRQYQPKVPQTKKIDTQSEVLAFIPNKVSIHYVAFELLRILSLYRSHQLLLAQTAQNVMVAKTNYQFYFFNTFCESELLLHP